MSQEQLNAIPAAKNNPVPPASVNRRAGIPVFVDLPPQTQATPAAASAEELIRALQDSSAETACDAAIALGELGDHAAVAPLIDVVENFGGYFHEMVRVAACASLGGLGDRSATPALLNAINDPMAETSAAAIGALAAIGDERAVEPLMAVLRNADGFFLPVVRLAAAAALQQFKSPAASAALEAVATDIREDLALRAAAAPPESSVEITHESIAEAAYEIWQKHGRREGEALADWLQAEGQLRTKDF
jgi:hypothetical protein